ncbi:4'-phosphopantetheinyl transferase family protein [Nocardioides pacificus]
MTGKPIDLGDVSLAWHGGGELGDAALAEHVRRALGAGVVRTGRLCPRCGSGDHGRPWARLAERPVEVSLSRADGHLVTAISHDGPVGVDVESIADVAEHWDAAMVLAPGEEADTDLERARVWTRKEAVLKAYGVGLARPMTDLVLADFPGRIADVDAPDGFVAALALLAARS